MASVDSELYSPLPPGYNPGTCKYVVVVGTVMSGLGKGVFMASLGKLFQDRGYRVEPIKLEGYYNMDAGTLNPYRHGEVFVLDDGMETDMDLGTYERALNRNLCSSNFSTNGQIMAAVLRKEREGGYLGRDVQAIPHVTGEIKMRIRNLAMEADIVMVEIGGTVGDFENVYYLEACRQLAYEEMGNVIFVALTYVVEPGSLGEQKTKAAQLGVKRLTETGIMPHILVCRAENPVDRKILDKIALHSGVSPRRVMSLHDIPSIYDVPKLLSEAAIDEEIISLLGLSSSSIITTRRTLPGRALSVPENPLFRSGTRNFARNPISTATGTYLRIGLAGKYVEVRDAYASIIKAFEHCEMALGHSIIIQWIDTEIEGSEQELDNCDGLLVPGGFGERGIEGKIRSIRKAREENIPFLGICLGMQLAVVEYARNVSGLTGAGSTEMSKDCRHPVIDLLPDQEAVTDMGGSMRLGGQDIIVKENTMAWVLLGERVRYRFRHRYEVNPDYVARLEHDGMVFSGFHPSLPIVQIVELPSHPFFIATQAHPELTSRPDHPDPLFIGLIRACLNRSS